MWKAILPLTVASLLAVGAVLAPTVKDMANSYDTYDGLLSSELDITESTVAGGLTPQARKQRMLEATIYVTGPQETAGGGLGGSSLGSGVIIDNKRCLAVTNNHVTEGMAFVKVQYATGWRGNKIIQSPLIFAEIVGHPSEDDDLALIKLDRCDGAAWAPLAEVNNISYGAEVFAAGNPMGLKWSLSEGVISNPGQDARQAAWAYIQTDATINKGNSGGPLFLADGSVAGINSEIYSQSGGSDGLGFARPGELVKKFLRDVSNVGHVTRPRIGIMIAPLTLTEADIAGVASTPGTGYTMADLEAGFTGVSVASDPAEGAPGAIAGIQQGDILLTFNGEKLYDLYQLIRLVESVPVYPGSDPTVEIKLLRDGEVLTKHVVLEDTFEIPEPKSPAQPYEDLMGWTLEINPEKFGGVDLPVVTDKAHLSPAFKTEGLQEAKVFDGTPTPLPLPGAKAELVAKGFAVTAIAGVYSTGDRDGLELADLPAEERIDALNAFIKKAHDNGDAAMLRISRISKVEADLNLPEGLPEDIKENLTVENLMAQAGMRNGEDVFFIEIFPQPFKVHEGPETP